MILIRLLLVVLISGSLVPACKKKEKKGRVSAQLMKSETASDALVLSQRAGLKTAAGSMVQSFTPTSLTIPIYKVSLCKGTSDCTSIYSCSENCDVEISDIDAFVDTLNAGTTELEDGETFDHIGVEYCQEDNRDEIQHITLSGTVEIQGTTYVTDPDDGLVEGSKAKTAAIDIKGGCASGYPLIPEVTVSQGETQDVKLFFDASLYAMGGVAGGSDDSENYSESSCVGSAAAYVCAQVTTIVATIDEGEPVTEHYLLANIDDSEEAAPTASVALYFSSDDTPIGGVQSFYRLSGPTQEWGTAMSGGLGLIPKTVDSDTVSFGEPEGSVSLADWFQEFKRKSHSGAYTYSGPGGAESEGVYKATKL
jgi:hypothetical protein